MIRPEDISNMSLVDILALWEFRVIEGGGVGHIYEDELNLLRIHVGLEDKKK